MRLSRSLIIISVGLVCGRLLENSASSTTAIAARGRRVYPPCAAKNPAPSGSVCGAYGSYQQQKHPERNIYQKAPALATCVQLFINPDYAYGSIWFNDTSGLCTFSPSQIQKLKLNNSSDTVFYDYSCFHCPSYSCPLPQGVNLLRNPGFELSSNYAGPWQISAQSLSVGQPVPSVSSPGSNSSHAIHFPSSNAIENLLRQYVGHCKSNLYSINFDYKIAEPPGGNTSSIQLNLDDFSYIYLSKAPTNGSWIKFHDIYINENEDGNGGGAFSLETLTDQFHPSPLPDVFIDNANIHSISSTLNTVPGAKSAVVNGGFESGQLSPWVFMDEDYNNATSQFDSHSIVSPGIGSPHAFQFSNSATAPDDNGIVQKFTLTQTLALSAGTRYRFSMDVSGLAADVYWSIGSRYFREEVPSPAETNATTTYVSAFIAQSNTADLVIQITYGSDKDPGSLLVDNISILKLK